MKNLLAIPSLLFISFLVSAQKQKAKQPGNATPSGSSEIKIPFTADRWDFQEGKVEFLDYKGLKAVRLNENSGDMICKNLHFTNGTIEFDVEVNRAQPFPSVYFRWQNKTESELVYLRTGTAGNKNAFDAVQYASVIKGVNLWDLQHEFQSSADIKIGEWNHVKLVVSGKKLRVYVNNPVDPNLEIPCVEGNTKDGRIGIGTGFPGEAIFANLVIKPNETEGLSEEAGADLAKHDTRYIRTWQVSETDSLPPGKEVNAFMLPKNNVNWENINAERRGLVNLSRKFGLSSYRKFVWLKAKINSAFNQYQLLRLGFSDEIWVFVNQRPVYVDKNIYTLNMRKSPNGRISLDNCSFSLPLVKGENELMIAVANDFFGWGIMARLETLEGISF